jgi:predicted outer membrane repeat protein
MPSDSDGDGLTDVFEARTGWDVVLPLRTYHVLSDPRQVDQDGDGLNDAQEFAIGTDPTRADTDDDGLSDQYDSFPVVPAKVLRVKTGAAGLNNGNSWANALTNLQDALALARNGLASTGDPNDDVAEIWVSAGVYKPTSTTNRNVAFELVNNTALYGGFTGVETKLSQRESDPLLNDTILSGDLLGNDTSTPWDDPASFTNDNSYAVCVASGNIGFGTGLDGFTITGGSAPNYGGGLFSYGRPRLKNLFFRANYGLNGAGLYAWPQGATMNPYVISDCLFLQNGAPSGGAMRYNGSFQSVILSNCQFYANAATATGTWDQGAGALVVNGPCTLENCTFAWNTSAKMGGAITVLRPATVTVSRCEFIGNSAATGGGGIFLSDELATTGDFRVEVLQSVFWGNTTPAYGGAIWANNLSANKQRLFVLSSTIVSNTATSGGGPLSLNNCVSWVENSILWGSTNRLSGGPTVTVRTTCLHEAANYPGNGNIDADPKFVDSFGGNLRLATGSPCIDRGNNYMDFHPTIPGWQALPDTDLDGNWRIVDGNNDGYFKVDIGAYERQGP